jgi:hypothetical protein
MKIRLETLKDFQGAMTQAMDCVKEMLTADFTDEEAEAYLHGDYDDVILTLVTARMKRDFTFSQDIIGIVGPDDELFN